MIIYIFIFVLVPIINDNHENIHQKFIHNGQEHIMEQHTMDQNPRTIKARHLMKGDLKFLNGYLVLLFQKNVKKTR